MSYTTDYTVTKFECAFKVVLGKSDNALAVHVRLMTKYSEQYQENERDCLLQIAREEAEKVASGAKMINHRFDFSGGGSAGEFSFVLE